ncbi:hypothetical protein RJ639_047557 [Escallonia herrerae]|uniref:Reverse transcriptase Ty1/copia-type domain-containing protein n=1 Tax=Escallonia herrerae TaxID=1293975 RepID=A0AA88WAY1_9ASTE|nr:hypothetical protein RJ639_047557 [Escallonia herrerae]
MVFGQSSKSGALTHRRVKVHGCSDQHQLLTQTSLRHFWPISGGAFFSSSKKTITISADEYAKLAQRQESVAAFAESVLNEDVPYNVLFPTKPLFLVEPQIFGSTCFVHDVRPHLMKLDRKALKCVCLGYSRLQKGYRCYSPDLYRYLVSANVVFSKHSPFFSSKSDSSSKGDDDDWLMFEIFPSLPIEPPISEDRTLKDGLSVSVPIEPSNATDGASSGVAQSEDVDCLGEQAILPSAPVKSPIVQVHSRRREHHDTCPTPAASSSDPPPNDLDLPSGLHKARLIAKRFAQTCGVDYSDTLSPMAKLTFVPLFISLMASLNWSLHQLDIKNAVLHGDLLEELKYFLGIEVTRSKKGIFLSQRKYVLDLLAETGKVRAKPCNTLMNPSVHLTKDDIDRLDDPEKCRRLVGKLNYLTVTCPDIAYAVSIVSQFMSELPVKHWAALKQILCYLKGLLKGSSRLGLAIQQPWTLLH